uniref:OSJNBb0003B01.19 protein n=1 Tax=Oryza sativa subsp. japonica TaxID=39947 RepID=Q7XPG4_ORYSJ|nr:OSJNBb0003B01.19 [Oryza sativa Japonica Group]
MTRIPNARDGGDPLDTEDGFWSSGDQRSKDPIEVAAARGLLLVLLGNGRFRFLYSSLNTKYYTVLRIERLLYINITERLIQVINVALYVLKCLVFVLSLSSSGVQAIDE